MNSFYGGKVGPKGTNGDDIVQIKIVTPLVAVNTYNVNLPAPYKNDDNSSCIMIYQKRIYNGDNTQTESKWCFLGDASEKISNISDPFADSEKGGKMQIATSQYGEYQQSQTGDNDNAVGNISHTYTFGYPIPIGFKIIDKETKNLNGSTYTVKNIVFQYKIKGEEKNIELSNPEISIGANAAVILQSNDYIIPLIDNNIEDYSNPSIKTDSVAVLVE